MSDLLRTQLVESIIASLAIKGTKKMLNPLHDFLSNTNTTTKAGWLRKSTTPTKVLGQEDMNMFHFLLMLLAGYRDKRPLLFKAFGADKRHKQLAPMFASFESGTDTTVAPFLQYVLSYKVDQQQDCALAVNDTTLPPSSLSLLPSPSSPSLMPLTELVATPRKVGGSSPPRNERRAPYSNDINNDNPDPEMPPVQLDLFGVGARTAENTASKRLLDTQSPLLSPSSKHLGHRSKHRGRPAARGGTTATTNKSNGSNRRVSFGVSQSLAAPNSDTQVQSTIESNRHLNGLLLSPSLSQLKRQGSIEISRRLNGLLLTPSLSVLDDQIKNGGVHVNQLLQTATARIIASLNNNNNTGMIALSHKNRQDKTRLTKLAVIAQARPSSKPASDANSKKKWQRKARTIRAFIDVTCVDDNERGGVLKQYVDEYLPEFQLTPSAEAISGKLTVEESICLRDFVGTTTNGMLRLARGIQALLPGTKLFPAQLKKVIAETERKAVPMDILSVELSINKHTKASCMFLRCRNPPLLLERMIASAHIAGKAQDASEISNYSNCNLLFLGLDRGGGDTYLGVRNGNRSNGNQAEYCYPLAVVELASESFENLKATFFQPGSITCSIYQDLIDDAMHIIELVVHEKSGRTMDSQCILLRLVPFIEQTNSTGTYWSSSNVTVSLYRMLDKYIGENDALDGCIKASERGRATLIRHPTICDTNVPQAVRLYFQLIRRPGAGGYIGIAIYSYGNQLLGTFLFERPLETTAKAKILAACNLMKGFASHDGKCAVCISGQSSCGSVRPCLKCIGKKTDFRKYREWMHQHKPDTIDKPAADEALRIGEYTNTVLFQKFRVQIGDGMYHTKVRATTADKHVSCSVVDEPCARVDPFKESGGPMHICSGMIDHVITDTRAALKVIDKEGPFSAAMTAFAAELQAYIDTPTTGAEAQKNIDAQFAKRISKLRKSHVEEQSTERQKQLQNQINDLQTERYAHASTSGFGATNLLRKGAKETLDLTTEMLDAATKHCGESDFAFNKGIELTGARFRKEHGGMSLSNQHSMLVSQHYKRVAEAVEATYATEPTLRARVLLVMTTFRCLMAPAYRISVTLKSQEKVSPEALVRLKDDVCEFSIAFRDAHPTKDPYPKLHWLECILVPYAEMHGFIGRGSEEGFESAHNRLAWIKKLLSAMPFMQDRGTKMGQRYQVSLQPGFDAIWNRLQPPPTTRAPYKKKSAAEKQSKQVPRLEAVVDPGNSLNQFGIYRLPSGNCIFEAWKERYEFVAYGTATESLKGLIKDNPIFQQQHNHRLRDVINYV